MNRYTPSSVLAVLALIAASCTAKPTIRTHVDKPADLTMFRTYGFIPQVGTANVDVVAARKRQVIREGIAEGRLTDQVMRDPQTAINSVIGEMFTRFPGRAAT